MSLYSICPTALLISISAGSVITSFFLTVRDPRILKTADLRIVNDSLVLSQFVTTLSFCSCFVASFTDSSVINLSVSGLMPP